MQINFDSVTHDWVITHQCFCFWTLGAELRIMQLYMRKHTQCCSLQTSTANPYSRGTFPQTVPSSSTNGTRPVWPNFSTTNWVHPHSWQQITDQPHDTERIKTRIHTCAHTQKYEARATHVMLAQASTTALACTQSSKPLSDAQVGSNSGGWPKVGYQHWDE